MVARTRKPKRDGEARRARHRQPDLKFIAHGLERTGDLTEGTERSPLRSPVDQPLRILDAANESLALRDSEPNGVSCDRHLELIRLKLDATKVEMPSEGGLFEQVAKLVSDFVWRIAPKRRGHQALGLAMEAALQREARGAAVENGPRGLLGYKRRRVPLVGKRSFKDPLRLLHVATATSGVRRIGARHGLVV